MTTATENIFFRLTAVIFSLFLVVLSTIRCADLPQPLRPNVPPENLLLVSGSDFSSGFLSALALDGDKLYRDIYPLHSDAVIRTANQLVYALNGYGMDNITILDPHAGYLPRAETSAGRTANPRDAAIISSDLVAISLYDSAQLLLIDPQTGRHRGHIDLSNHADSDGIPEMAGLYYHNGFLYLALQRLNRNGTGVWPPVGESRLLKIDPVTRDIAASFVLPFTNPISRLRYFNPRNSLVFAAPGRFGANFSLDGGVIEFSLDSETFLTSPLREDQIGSDITDAILVSPELAFAVTQDQQYITRLIAFDPQNGSLLATLATSDDKAGYFADFLLGPDNRLYLADRNYRRPGIRIFDTVSLSEQTTSPLDTGLPPYTLELLP